MTDVWNSALAVLWVAPVVYAVAVLFDNDFIGQGIYQTRGDGVVISTLFGGLLPLLVIAPQFEFTNLLSLPATVLLTAVVGGIVYLGHLYYYFDVLFTPDDDGKPINDGSSLELLLTLNVIFVPVCAWILFDQSLNGQQWTGVLIILLAALMMSGIRGSRKTMTSGLMSGGFLAVHLLCEDYVYDQTDITTGFFVFCTVLLISGITMLAFRKTRPRASLFKPVNLIRFTAAEAIGILAILFAHRALELNPAVFVVAVDCFVPIFVAVISLVPTFAVRFTHWLSSLMDYRLPDMREALDTYAAQRKNFLMKLGSAAVMGAGTVLLLGY